MGVDIDKAGRDDPAGGVDGLGRRAGETRADIDDPAARDRDIAGEGRSARAVGDRAAGDQQIGLHHAASTGASGCITGAGEGSGPRCAQNAPSASVSTSTAPRTPSAARASASGRWK